MKVLIRKNYGRRHSIVNENLDDKRGLHCRPLMAKGVGF